MTDFNIPSFSRLATDGDDSRWLADQAAQRRAAAARQARASAAAVRETIGDSARALRTGRVAALTSGAAALAIVLILAAHFILPQTRSDRAPAVAEQGSRRAPVESAASS